MSGGSADAAAAFRSRLFFTLVEDVLAQAEIELVDVKSVRFLADYPWAPGKRLRPITFLLSNFSVRLERGVSLDSNGRESRLAAAIELLHEASLVHDDLVDGSTLRRGAPTMHMMNGQGLALLIGDYMVFRGLKLILDAAESRDDIVLAKELANTGLAIAQGEADQLDRYLRNPGWDERMSMDSYLDLIAKKTAAFFAGCAEGGAALAGASPGLRKVYRDFGMNMGLVFQMVDDLMDVLGEAAIARKTLRHNLAEGTVTLPMIHAWELDPAFPPLRRLAAGEPLGARAEESLYRRLATPEVLGRCRETMDEYAARSMSCVASMPVGIFRHGLVDLLEYVRQCPWGGLGKQLAASA
jgi:geranylgeranyl pyrophosphate synthase